MNPVRPRLHLSSAQHSPLRLAGQDLTCASPSQFDSDEDDISIFSPGHEPAPRQNPYGPTASTSTSSAAHPPSSRGAHRDPFANANGTYNPRDQSQNPASYGGGQAANRFGTATDVSTQGMNRYDDVDEYNPF